MVTKGRTVEKQALAAAAEFCGGQTKLADALTAALGKTVSQQWVWSVINRPAPIPPEWCLALERITGGAFTRHQFRPDLYPRDESDVAPLRASA